MSILTRALLASLVVSSASCARIFRPEAYARWEACSKTIPLIRKVPDRDYRRIDIVKGSNEDELAWRACEMGADAVLVEGGDEVRATRKVKGIAIRWTGDGSTNQASN